MSDDGATALFEHRRQHHTTESESPIDADEEDAARKSIIDLMKGCHPVHDSGDVGEAVDPLARLARMAATPSAD